MSELISLVVPIYKVEKYLARCIESIMNQTYKNLEIILVDDGSPDNCGDICDYYAKKDQRIKVIHKKNGGLSDARNVGIDIARGDYIGFVDSDDYIHPLMYERLWDSMQSSESDIAVSNIEKVYGEAMKFPSITADEVAIYDGIQAIKNILDKNRHVVSVVAWGKLYKKSLFDGVRFPKGKIHEDEFTTYKLYYKSDRVVELSGRYYYYFQREDSIMGSKRKGFSYDGLKAYEEMADFFDKEENRELLYQVKYKYLYMLKEAIRELEFSEVIETQNLRAELEEKYRNEYKHCILKIQGLKRKIRLSLYYWFKINV